MKKLGRKQIGIGNLLGEGRGQASEHGGGGRRREEAWKRPWP